MVGDEGDEMEERDETTAAFLPDSAPHMIFEIRRAEGVMADDLRREQARRIREVVTWVARTRSEPGRDRAA